MNLIFNITSEYKCFLTKIKQFKTPKRIIIFINRHYLFTLYNNIIIIFGKFIK